MRAAHDPTRLKPVIHRRSPTSATSSSRPAACAATSRSRRPFARESGLERGPAVRRRLAELGAGALEVEMLALRVPEAMQRGRSAVVEAAASKVPHTVACQSLARAALDFGHPEALVAGSRAELLWRQSLRETIGGGTSEIMRGVVAKGGLDFGGMS